MKSIHGLGCMCGRREIVEGDIEIEIISSINDELTIHLAGARVSCLEMGKEIGI